MKLKPKIFSLLIALTVALPVLAQVMSPADMEYPVKNGRQYMVSDPASLLSPDTRAAVEKNLEDLRRETSVEVAVVIPPEIGDYDRAQWCEELFSRWKIGKDDKDNGLLVMISPGSKQAFIMPGYGMEGVFTDIACSRLLREQVVPAMREGNLDAAVTNVTDGIARAVRDPEAAAELRSDQKERYAGEAETLDPKIIWTFISWVAGAIFLVALVAFVVDCVRARRCRSNYEKAEFWRRRIRVFAVLGIFSLGAGLIFALLAWALYRSWRNRPLRCSTCGHKMKRLPEDKDNELLSDSQDFEEKLRTVDYDVWECPQCGTIERFPFRSSQKKYTMCPQCKTIAMSLESDAIVRPATTRRTGLGEKVYVCRYCHNRVRKPYVIPRKEDPSAALAAAAIIGSAASGRGHGGGSGGGFGGFGGFGGGSTGGGGAGASW